MFEELKETKASDYMENENVKEVVEKAIQVLSVVRKAGRSIETVKEKAEEFIKG